MGAGNVYTSKGEEFMIDAFDTRLSSPYIGAGTGTGTPAKGDTTLGTEVGSRVSATKTQASADTILLQASWVYDASRNITEVGLFTASSSGTLIQRHVWVTGTLVGTTGDKILFKLKHTQS